jgi:glycerol kinase
MGSIRCIGITNQRETTVAWDHDGRPFYNAIVWQCRRTDERCQKLRPHIQYIKKTTGLVTDPYFSSTKMEWLLKNVKNVQEASKKKNLHLGTIDSYLIFKLTNGKSFATDVTNASRTMLLNLKTLKWDPSLLKLFSLKEEFLPTVWPSGSKFGVTQNVPGLSDGIPITGVLGDQQAALFGQLATGSGQSKVTFGTGSFILLNTGSKIIYSRKGLLTTVAWQISSIHKPVYALEGGAFVCGAAVQWLRDQLGIISKSSDIESLANQVEDSGGVEFVPALTGLGAPHWNPKAKGSLFGLTRGANKAHIARATLEAMALQNVDVLSAMQSDMKSSIKSIRVDGGASQNNLLMQLQSDYSGVVVERPKQVETTTLGAGFMAGLSAGIWSDVKELEKVWQKDVTFRPNISKKVRAERLKKWKHAIEVTKTW